MGAHLEGGGLVNAMGNGGRWHGIVKMGDQMYTQKCRGALKSTVLGEMASGRMRHIMDSIYLNSNTDS